MKLGILTYHRAHNFGALLQAYALKQYLISIGYDVDIVDYFPHYHQQMYALWPWSYFKQWGFKQKLRFMAEFPFVFQKRQQRRELFERFINNHLKPALLKNGEQYDVLVYGSDQIWRYQDSPIYKGYNKAYFGTNDIPAKRHITYAASMGKMDQFDSNVDFFKTQLKNFDTLGIREQELLDKMQPLTDKDISLTLDPVFLLPKDVWSKIVPARKVEEKYILLYNLLSDPKLNRIAKELGEKKGIKVIEITGSIKKKKPKGNVETIVGPLDFLSYVYYAEHVITSSFHGVAFSIVFQKSFVTYLPKNFGRVTNLLNSIGLGHLFIKEETLKDLGILQIDYPKVDELLQPLISKSKAYLDKAIVTS